MSPGSWQLGSTSTPFADVKAALEKLKGRYRLVALSNGENGLFRSSSDQPHWLGLRPHYLGSRK